MPTNQNTALRIFLSSTAIDMQEHRQKVTEALLRLDKLPVKMEAFGAAPSSPVEVCKTKVKESDALVVMLAHRYGWVPTPEEGGDGKKSITWIEVETAIENQIPVFAFIVDDQFGWTHPKEQDQITTTKDPVKIAEIIKNVQSLDEFKKFLDTKAGLTREKFTTPENLALSVATSVTNWVPNQTPSKKIVSKRPPFQFRIVHHLQPAPHFKGRKKLLEELKQWWLEPVTPDRVRSLVAIGGTGKTAIAERFLDSIKNERLRGSVLVWSFYDEPNTDAFLREACILFTGEEPEGEGGKLEKLQRALTADNSQHLIVLDGLERIQSEGKGSTGHSKGDIEDHRIKNLLRAVAAGLGNTRVLITTRFKLTDLAQWENAGYKSHELDVLDEESAIEVLKAWEIKAEDKTLNEIAKSVGRHALSVSVLGSYLNHYCNCDPDGVKEFKLDEISPDEPLAARLGRILGGYAKSLPDQERDLIIRLSVFPKGVSVDILAYLVNAGGEIAGALINATQQNLLIIAERLKQQGLIYSYNNQNTIVYTSHPFLREYFRKLLGVKPEDIHEVVREKLAIGLDTRPENPPNDTETLDRYEKLIEYSVLAGHYQEAFGLFDNVMGGKGGYSHIYHKLSDYGRITRIVSLFSKDGTPSTISEMLDDSAKGKLINDWGLTSASIGDFKKADLCFSLAKELYQKKGNKIGVATILQNQAGNSIHRALFPTAKKILEHSLQCLENEDKSDQHVKNTERFGTGYLGYVFHNEGDISLATDYFAKATAILNRHLSTIDGFYETEHLLAIGDTANALRRTKENIAWNEKYNNTRDLRVCYYMLGLLDLPNHTSKARENLMRIREWTEKSGHMQSILHSHILASKIAYYSDDYPSAIAEATTGLNHAESCGFGKYAIDLQLLLSKIHLAIPDYKIALSYARQAFERSANPECGYAWGEANGLHFAGVCHKAMGENELARQRLTAALALREKIQHPEVEETRKLLAELPVK